MTHGDVFLLSKISRPWRLTEVSKVLQLASLTSENSQTIFGGEGALSLRSRAPSPPKSHA